MYLLLGKRIIDIFLTFFLLVFLTPIIVFLIIILFVQFKRNLLYKQVRHTMGQKEFTIYKFRTMIDKYDTNYKLLPDSQRLTHLGRFLRETSLDEIPSLINVLKGDMSFIGPRPLPVRYSTLMSPTQLQRYRVRSGLTGLAQIIGRNSVPWETRMKLDVLYANQVSFWIDLTILLKSPRVLFSKSRIENLDFSSFDDYKPNFIEGNRIV